MNIRMFIYTYICVYIYVLYICVCVDTPFISLLASCEPWLGILAEHYSNWTNFEPSAAWAFDLIRSAFLLASKYQVSRVGPLETNTNMVSSCDLKPPIWHHYNNFSRDVPQQSCCLFPVRATSLVRKLQDVRLFEVIGFWRIPKHLLTDWSIDKHKPSAIALQKTTWNPSAWLGYQLHNKCSSKNELYPFSPSLFRPAQRKPTAA